MASKSKRSKSEQAGVPPPKPASAPPKPSADEPTRVPPPAESETPPRRDPRGGARPGAGRPTKRQQAEREIEARKALHQKWAEAGSVLAKQGRKLLDGLSNWLVRASGKKEAALTDEEKTQLGEAAGTVIAKYSPEAAEEYIEEIALAWAIVTILGPRALDIFWQDEKKDKTRDVPAEVVPDASTNSPPEPRPASTKLFRTPAASDKDGFRPGIS